MREAAGSMKRLVLELGGKDPMLVFPGSNLEAAAKYAAEESVRNSGQVCISVERVLVHASVAEAFEEAVCRHVDALRVGNPMEDETEVGPMVSDRQRQLVLDQLADARSRGARFLLEGKAVGPGFFLTPSVVAGVTDEMELGRNETFGPVVAISRFEETDEAIRRANATRYGLGASVWGGDDDELDAIARRLEAGMIGINRGLSAAGSAPWVGWKQSGFGYTRSTAGMRQFMQPRTLSRNVET
jgi:acyl-CoA reductase-like NAD-dependent aldehyde dehydrogenase